MKFSIQDAAKIKLVIWDLDETFWKGTLSDNESTLEPVLTNIDLVKKLTYRGIINAVCSKNDKEEAERELKKLGVSNYFVFNSINWNSKGPRIQSMLSAMALRPANVLFLDDNPSNQGEAEFILPDLMVSGPEIIPALYERVDSLGKDDSSLSRLNQYKVLEKKKKDSENYTSNDDFLRQSNIRVVIKKLDDNAIPRVAELIQRSNQLNFTKKRIDEKELRKLSNDNNYDLGYVSVADNYGIYGIIGFYALDKRDNRLEHFLFSCRTMGMGIEQYIYALLDYPVLEVVEPVSGSVSREEGMPDYIHRVAELDESIIEPKKKENTIKVLLKGPCDLEVMASYLEGNGITLDTEFNFVDHKGNQADYCNHLVNVLNDGQPFVKNWCEKYSFLSDEAFVTNMFDGSYRVVCLSPLMDATLAVYENSEAHRIAYGINAKPLSDPRNQEMYIQKKVMTARSNFSAIELNAFSKEFHQIQYSPSEIVSNLSTIINKINQKNSNTNIVIMLLGELKYESKDPEYLECFADKHILHRKINDVIRKQFSNNKKVYLLDVNKYIKNQSDYFDNINHYSKYVYYEMAQEFAEYIDSITDGDMGTSSKGKMLLQNMKRMVYKKLFVK